MISFDVILGAPKEPADSYYVKLRERWRPHDASFTIFLNSSQFNLPPRSRPPTHLNEIDRQRWLNNRGRPPRNHRNVTYARNLEVLDRRTRTLRHLDEIGVEVGSHGVRHQRGGGWNKSRWLKEFREHEEILQRHGLAKPAGYRAPHLEVNDALLPALSELGYRFDASFGASRRWPRKFRNLWRIGVPQIPVSEVGDVLLFDLKMRETLESLAAEGQPINQLYYEAVYREFRRRYESTRAPLAISGHGHLFIAPITRLVRKVCPLPNVRCVTFSEVVAYLDAHPELEGKRVLAQKPKFHRRCLSDKCP